MDRLTGHGWPGNLRELKRVMHTAVAVTAGEVILPEALLLESGAEPAASGPTPLPGSIPAILPSSEELSLAGAEDRHIRFVLGYCGGNKRRAARLLGVSRSTLDRKLGKVPGSTRE
jgi:DNA-binding NtrC family response regulator